MTRGREMADYRKMYTVLCCAIDDVIDDLAQIPKARQSMSISSERYSRLRTFTSRRLSTGRIPVRLS